MDRLNLIRDSLKKWNIDGILIESGSNYRWLSGFKGSRCSLLVTQKKALLGTDFRYWEQAKQQSPEFELVKFGVGEGLANVGDMIHMSGVRRLGLEGNHVTLSKFKILRHAIKDVDGFKFVTLSEPIEGLRLSKSKTEIDTIRRAVHITDEVMGLVPQIAHPGMTERTLAWELEKAMRDRGADSVAFDIIVAAGPNGAMAHHRPGDYEMKVGDPIIIDMGCKIDGYHSDLTRTFFLGNQPDDTFKYVYGLVLLAQKNALSNIKAGLTGKEADSLARDVIDEAGHGDHFGHSLGHGVGLNIHELPRFASSYDDEIPENSIMSVEPGVYLPGWGGVRIEDLVIVQNDGVEILSAAPKDPIIPVS
ncbi:MAG: aminopeptidase P family protein [Chloroflexota bacterium]